MEKPIILCVDEDIIMLERVTTLLQKHVHGMYRVIGIPSYSESVTYYTQLPHAKSTVALVIINQCLAGGTCLDALAKMLKINATLSIIAFIGDMERLTHPAIVVPPICLQLLPKPWVKDQLLAAVDSVLKPFQAKIAV